MKKILLYTSSLLLLSACTTHEAAVIGAIPGRMIGIPLGMAITAVDESFNTANDIVKANPRYARTHKINHSISDNYYHPRPSRNYAKSLEPNYHYYKAEVLVKTYGPTQIESLQLLESNNVTDFWR